MIWFADGRRIYEVELHKDEAACCISRSRPSGDFTRRAARRPIVVMLGILNEIRNTGKLTSARDHAQLSYRHVWNLVEQWSEFFGVPLVETQRGKGTTLTAFGEKLVWAGQRMQARLGPQLENLAQELATEIKPFLHQRPCDPRSCQPRLRRFEAARVARPRARHRRRPALCQQPEFAGVAGAGRLRPLRRASAAWRRCARRAFRPARNGSIRARTGSSVSSRARWD